LNFSAIDDLPPPTGSQQIKNLLALFQALGRVAEIGNDLLDHFLHAVELAESGIYLDDLVGEDARQARVEAGVDQGGFADCGQHALGSAGVSQGIFFAKLKVLRQGVFLFPGTLIAGCVVIKNGHVNVL
jgi:hypothetical protein